MNVGDAYYVFVVYRDSASGLQLTYRYMAPYYVEQDDEEQIREAVRQATKHLTPWDVYEVIVFTEQPRRFDVRHSIEERT